MNARARRIGLLLAVLATGLVAGAQAALAVSLKGTVVTRPSSYSVVIAKSDGTLVRVRLPKKQKPSVVGHRVALYGVSADTGVYIAAYAKIGKAAKTVKVAGSVIAVDGGVEFIANGGGLVGVIAATPDPVGSNAVVTASIGRGVLTRVSSVVGVTTTDVRLSGVLSGLGPTMLSLRLPGGANLPVLVNDRDLSSPPVAVGDPLVLDVTAVTTTSGTSYLLKKYAVLKARDAFKFGRKAETQGIVTAVSGQRMTVKPLVDTAVEFVLGPTVTLSTVVGTSTLTIGKDDTVLVDSHLDGSNVVADHVVLLGKAVPAVIPTVTFTAVPPPTTTAHSATFDWSTDVPGDEMLCYLPSPVTCTPPYTIPDVPSGAHVFQVAVYNAKGWSVPATFSWQVVEPVSVVITSTPPATTIATDATFEYQVTGNATDFKCSLDGANYAACTKTLKSGTTDTYVTTYTGLPVGAHNFDVYVSNSTALSTAPVYGWTVVPPTVTPVVTITSAPSDPTNGTSTSGAVAFTIANDPTTITCRLDADTAAACTSPYNLSNLSVGSHTVTVSGANSAGTHTASATWTVQPLAPTVTLTSPPTGDVASTSASIAWTTTNSPTTTTCQLDAAAAAACTSPKSYTGLSAGAHTVVVTVTNVTGSGSASASWNVVVAPTVTITTPPTDGTSTSAAVPFTTTGNPTGVTCALDGGTAAACTSPYSVSGLSVASHTVVITATNIASSVSDSATWTVQPLAPTVTLTSPPTGDVASTSASIAWTTTNSPTTTTCKLDAAAAAACTSPKSYSGLAAGAHTVVVTVTNVTGTASASAAWNVVVAPTLTISPKPTTSTSTSAALPFTTTGSPTTVTCKLDNGTAAACTSPYSVSGLSVASHTVTITATNIAGSGSDSATWTVSAPQVGAPVVTLTTPPTGSVASTSASIAWTATNSPTSTTCKLDAAAAAACTSPKSYTGLAAGAHTVVVTATNGTGSGSATAAWTVVVAPTVTITASPSSSTSTSGVVSFTTANSPTSTTCQLDAGTAAGCTSPYSMSGLAVGSHTVTVAVTNIAGTNSATTTAWNVQAGAPVVTLTSPPTGSVASTSASIAWTATNTPTSTTCQLDAAAAAACTSPKAYTGLAAGAHTVVVTATNGTGSGSATAAWTVVVAPTVTITASPSSSTSTSGVVSFTTANSPTSTTCQLDAGTAASCTSPFSVSGLAVGSHTVTVAVTNIAGTNSATTTAWTVQAGAPVVTLTSAPTGTTTTTSASIAWTATNSPTSTTCSLDGATATACTSPKAYTGLPLGSHTVVVTATNATASGSATAAWTIVDTAPTVAITAGSKPAATNAPNAASFVWTLGGGAPTSTTCKLDAGSAVTCTTGTTQSYTALAAGSHTFTVTVSNSGGTASDTYTWSVAAAVAAPTISLTQVPTPSTTATTATIAWSTTGTVTTTTCSYDGVNYTPCTSPVNLSGVTVASHSFIITASNSGGSASATAAWTVTSSGGGTPAPLNTAVPTLSLDPATQTTWKPRSGTAGKIGYVLNGTWSNTPTSYAYQWMRCTSTAVGTCTNIAGATTSSYHAVEADIDLYLRCIVTATNAGGSTAAVTASSAMTQPS